MLAVAVAQLQEVLYPEEPRHDLTEGETDVLTRGGLDLSRREAGEESALASTTARYAAILGTSLTTAEAARRLGVDPARIRQRLAARTLYGIRTPQGWRLPAFQFHEDGALPGIEEVLPRLGTHLHPVAIHNFLSLPNADLHSEDLDRDLSPREWLRAGFPTQAIADLAAVLS